MAEDSRTRGLIHVGAWDGREYVADATHRPRDLLLFEPQADAFKRLQANLGKFDRAILIRSALGSKTGRVAMHTSSPDYSSSILKPKDHLKLFPAITFNGIETVTMTTLDQVIDERGLGGRYGEMVIDVQGYELEVLKGAEITLGGIRKIECEVSTDEVYEDGAHLEEVDDFLRERGFERTSLDLWASDIHGDATYERD